MLNYKSDSSIKLPSDLDDEEEEFKGYSDITVIEENSHSSNGVVKKRNSTKYNSKTTKMEIIHKKSFISPKKNIPRKYTISQSSNLNYPIKEKYTMLRQVRNTTTKKESSSYGVSELSLKSNAKETSSFDP
jgi:hypothetical protein